MLVLTDRKTGHRGFSLYGKRQRMKIASSVRSAAGPAITEQWEWHGFYYMLVSF